MLRIAIISDTHDNVWKIKDAKPHLKTCDLILHCGDLCSPFMIKHLVSGLEEKEFHIVWGNNDGDKLMIFQVAQEAKNVKLHGDFADFEADGKRIGLTHYPKVGKAIFESGLYDLVCFGHDHSRFKYIKNGKWLINPGELMGLNGLSTFAILSLQDNTIEWVELS